MEEKQQEIPQEQPKEVVLRVHDSFVGLTGDVPVTDEEDSDG